MVNKTRKEEPDAMNIILFGPPGVGKSTLIGYLKTRGMRAIDLEDVYPNRMRFQIPNNVDGVVIGAADLNPKRAYHHAIKVLLWMPQSDYELRRKWRDRTQPDKASQTQHLMSHWDPANTKQWQYVIDVRGTIAQTASKIEAIYKKYHLVVS